MPNLGDVVKDEISGFTGTVLAKMDCLYEENQCRVHPNQLRSSGEIMDCVWFTESRLHVIEQRNKEVGFKGVKAPVGK